MNEMKKQVDDIKWLNAIESVVKKRLDKKELPENERVYFEKYSDSPAGIKKAYTVYAILYLLFGSLIAYVISFETSIILSSIMSILLVIGICGICFQKISLIVVITTLIVLFNIFCFIIALKERKTKSNVAKSIIES